MNSCRGRGWDESRRGILTIHARTLTRPLVPTGCPACPWERVMQVVVLLIGINNDLDTQPETKLDWLLGWMAVAMPRTKVLVVAPLPSLLNKSAYLLENYRMVVRRRTGVHFSTCGNGLDPTYTSLFTDGLHLSATGKEASSAW